MPQTPDDSEHSFDWGSRFLAAVMDSPLPPMLTIVAVVLGVVAMVLTPREEEPQIVVPLADVMITAPGLGAAQIERQVATPLEKLLSQIDGVEHVYSMSQPGRAVVTVRFFVGEDREDSLIKVYNKVFSNIDLVPAAVTSWVVKPIEVDDVPILTVALWSDDPSRTSDHELRRLAEELAEKIKSIENTNRVEVTGGRPRQLRVELNPEAMAARQTTALEVAWAIEVSNRTRPAGVIQQRNENIIVEAGTFIGNADALRSLVVNVVNGVPIQLADVATVIDGPAEPADYTWLGFGPADPATIRFGDVYPAVVVSVAKQKGTNAVWVARDVHAELARLEKTLFSPEVHYRVIRDYGRTADQKVDDLIESLFVAVITVIVFLGLFLGWRPAIVVAIAVPICYGATLGLDLLAGYTINRVTLFALILALGLLVDDPITGIDNIERFFRIGGHTAKRSIVLAIAEIRGALIMATIAIIVAFAPLAFITGMMGPYMAPMAFNVPVSVGMSMVVAFLITPWLSYHILRHQAPERAYEVKETLLYRVYSPIVRPLIAGRARAWGFIAVVIALFVAAALLPALRLVPLKLLPFDNKDEFQIVIDLPEGATLEQTQAVALRLAGYLRTVPEVEAFGGFVGVPSPMDFNGMVRHYYLRRGAHMADLRVTLAGRRERRHQSHEIVTRIRRDVADIAAASGANVKLIEVPPGPPVISTITVELYGEPATPYAVLQRAAETVAGRLHSEPLVVDIDTSVEADQLKQVFVTAKAKAALSGVGTEDAAQTIALATDGMTAAYLQVPTEANPLPIRLRLPLERRSSIEDLRSLYVKGRSGITKVREKGGTRDAPRPLVQLGEIGTFEEQIEDQTIYHKDLKRVVYVFAELAGRPPGDAVVDMIIDHSADVSATARPLVQRSFLNPGGGMPWTLPHGVQAVWDGEGEWQITLRVFRDMGLAFAAALVGIFAVLYVQTSSAALALIIMSAIPLTVIGIMPGFWLLNQVGERVINDLPNPILFTATAMIGMIALAGIVVRNSLILVEFIHLALSRGMDLSEALIQAGSVRMRPVFLTAGTTLLGNLVITLDPIFSGLAWAIIFGIAASTVFTLFVVPVVYYLVYGQAPREAVARPGADAP